MRNITIKKSGCQQNISLDGDLIGRAISYKYKGFGVFLKGVYWRQGVPNRHMGGCTSAPGYMLLRDVSAFVDGVLTQLESEVKPEKIEYFYVQDNRQYVGNDILWWAANGSYTTDVSKARVFTKDQAIAQNKDRVSDIPWPKDYIDSRTRPVIDMQNVKIVEALEGSGIELNKPKVIKPFPYKCYKCGRFMTARQFYSSYCENCGQDNSL